MKKEVILIGVILICVVLVIFVIFNKSHFEIEQRIDDSEVKRDGEKFYYIDSNGKKLEADSDTAFELYKINPEYDPTIPGI